MTIFAAVGPVSVTDSPVQRVVSALIVNDEQATLRDSWPDVATSGPVAQTDFIKLSDMLSQVRKCDVGAVMKSGSSQSYTVNWWCAYRVEEEGGGPLEGAAALLTLRDGKVEFSKFSFQGPFARAPKAADGK